MYAYLQHGTGTPGPFLTEKLDVIIKPLPWQTRGLSFTATGYGARIPTRYMVRHNGKLRRVYCMQYSNAGTLFIGNRSDNLIISEIEGV